MKKFINLYFIFFLISTAAFAQSASHTIQEDPLLPELMSLNAKMTKANKIGQRYKVQLGSYNTIAQAKATEKKFKENYPDLSIRIQYESPNYKVWVGDYTSRLEADRLFLKIKREYRSAFVFQPNT